MGFHTWLAIPRSCHFTGKKTIIQVTLDGHAGHHLPVVRSGPTLGCQTRLEILRYSQRRPCPQSAKQCGLSSVRLVPLVLMPTVHTTEWQKIWFPASNHSNSIQKLLWLYSMLFQNSGTIPIQWFIHNAKMTGATAVHHCCSPGSRLQWSLASPAGQRGRMA